MSLLPPIMGWSTWNQFHQNISEKIVLEMAAAIKSSGLLDAGYSYINLDDCWQASTRDEDGRLCFDVGRFPNKEGIVNKINNMGFKLGLYSSCGSLTCEDMPGSYGFEALDAKTFVSWGVEYLKYDYCHVLDLPTDPHYNKEGFADKTPPILYLAVSGLESDGTEKVISAADAELTEPAFLDNGAIHGLSCSRASASFCVDVPKSGLYQLAIGYEKGRSPNKRFLLVTANGVADTQVWFPPTSGWFSPARVMANIKLERGRNKLMLTNPIRGQHEDTAMRYTRMGESLKNAAPHNKPIYFAICEHGRTEPWKWAAKLASSWRVSMDITPNWKMILSNYESAADLWRYQKPGAYNDPDMLEVGIGSLSDTENISHFVLWCMLSAPLVLGLDIRNADSKTLALLTNSELIAINQDRLLLQASRTIFADGLDLLIKPLTEGRSAVCFFNKSDFAMHDISLSLTELQKYDARITVNDNSIVNMPLENDSWNKIDNTLTIPAIAPRDTVLFIIAGDAEPRIKTNIV